MSKRTIYNRVYSTRKMVLNVVIIAFCIIGIILCFIFTSHFQGKNNNVGQLDLKSEIIVEVNQNFSKDIFFTTTEYVNLDKVEIKYPKDFNINKVGKYDIIVVINDLEYRTILIVSDTEKPVLTTKDLTILENEKYNAKDFVSSCTDNSKNDCIIEFYSDGVNEDGERISYTNYKLSGVYAIKVSAKDQSGNITTKEANLYIQKNQIESQNEPKQITSCKYGNDIYDKNNFVMAVNVTTKGCAISIDLWKEAGKYELDQITSAEITKIKKELKIVDGKPAITRQIVSIFNSNGTGIVGYELKFIVTVTKDEKTEKILEYKIDENGNRVYSNRKEL